MKKRPLALLLLLGFLLLPATQTHAATKKAVVKKPTTHVTKSTKTVKKTTKSTKKKKKVAKRKTVRKEALYLNPPLIDPMNPPGGRS